MEYIEGAGSSTFFGMTGSIADGQSIILSFRDILIMSLMLVVTHQFKFNGLLSTAKGECRMASDNSI